jgi:hypothetical protein
LHLIFKDHKGRAKFSRRYATGSRISKIRIRNERNVSSRLVLFVFSSW